MLIFSKKIGGKSFLSPTMFLLFPLFLRASLFRKLHSSRLPDDSDLNLSRVSHLRLNLT